MYFLEFRVVCLIHICIVHLDPIYFASAFLIVWTLPFNSEPWIVCRRLAETEKTLFFLFLLINDSASDIHLCHIVTCLDRAGIYIDLASRTGSLLI